MCHAASHLVSDHRCVYECVQLVRGGKHGWKKGDKNLITATWRSSDAPPVEGKIRFLLGTAPFRHIVTGKWPQALQGGGEQLQLLSGRDFTCQLCAASSALIALFLYRSLSRGY